MGHQIIMQPDGRLCVWSTVVDDLVLYDATPEELLDYYADRAAEEAVRRTQQILDAVLADDARAVYYQFTLTYDEALKRRVAASWKASDSDDPTPAEEAT
jgi:hypothetical protein